MKKTTTDIWSSIDETTWWKDNNWTGETYVFYTNNHGTRKCIHQIQGSGVYITSRKFIDFEIISNDEIKIEGNIYKLKEGKLTSKEAILTLYSNKPLINNRSCGPIDMNMVKSDEFIAEDIDKECKKLEK